MADNLTFVTIELSKKQVDMEHVIHNDKTNKDYARVFAPGGGTYFYPLPSIKVSKDDPNRVYFSRPEGTEIQVQYSHRKEGAPDDAPASEKYERHTKTWKIEDLKAAYEDERRAYAENIGFANMAVPTSWGKSFSSESGEFVSISIPIPENDKDVYYSFIVASDRFKESTKEEGKSYFGFPKKKKESTEDYMVSLKTSVKSEDGSYEDVYKSVSSMELKQYVERAVARSEVKDLFVSTHISGKLVRAFNSKDDKPLYSVSIPVYENGSEKASFYEFVVPAERIRALPDSNQALLSLFKNGPDGTAYTHTAKKSVPNGDGGYDSVSMDMTSEDVIEKFKVSKEKYMEAHNNANDHSMADEYASRNQNPVQNPVRRHGGR